MAECRARLFLRMKLCTVQCLGPGATEGRGGHFGNSVQGSWKQDGAPAGQTLKPGGEPPLVGANCMCVRHPEFSSLVSQMFSQAWGVCLNLNTGAEWYSPSRAG